MEQQTPTIPQPTQGVTTVPTTTTPQPPPGVTEQAAEAATTAKEQAGQVASTATEEAARIAGTAKESVVDITDTVKEQAATVRSDVAEQGKQLLAQAKDQATTTADQQVSKVSGSITSITEQVTALLEGRPEEAGQVKEIAQRAVREVESFASRIDERGVEGVLTDVRTFARRKPGAFLLLAGAAGLGVGMIARGARAAASTPEPTMQGYQPQMGLPGVLPEPALAFPTPPTVEPVAPYAPVPPVGTSPELVDPITGGSVR